MKKSFLSVVIGAALAMSASAFAYAKDVAVNTVKACGEKLNDALFAYQVKTGTILCAGGMDFVPNAADFNARRVTNPAQSEVVRQRFYDYQLYPTAGASQLIFFSNAIGAGVTSAQGAPVGSTKTFWDTNLEMSNTIPSGKAYMIETVEVLFTPGSVATANTYTPAALSVFAAVAAASVLAQLNDVNTFYQSGMLEINISSKNYLRETPLLAFPPKAHLDVGGAIGSNSATTSEVGFGFAKASGRPYILSPEITLQPAVNFDVKLLWPSSVPTPSGFNARVGVILDGYFMRVSQ